LNEHIQAVCLGDVPYQFWLNFGVTITAHPDYNCLWCVNDDLEVIRVVIPRDLILSSLELGGEFYSQYHPASPSANVGLAFIRHIQNNYDSSFLIPVIFNTEDNTELLDHITKTIVKYPEQVNGIIQTIKNSESYRETLRNLVIRKRHSHIPNLLTVPLRRATNWRRIKAIDSDYNVAPPIYWYTYENRELRLDFGFKYKMELRAFLRKPSISGLISTPFILLILLGYFIYRLFSDKLLKRVDSGGTQSDRK